MATLTLTQHDLAILDKIKDPEASNSSPVLIDPSLPRDPHITDPEVYASLVQQESNCIKLIMNLPLPPTAEDLKIPCETLSKIIEQYPDYASPRNNRAQALRMIYGDDILVNPKKEYSSISRQAETILSDLSTAISLLSPSSPYKAMHPATAKTLSQAYSQRGALYLSAANLISGGNTDYKFCLSPSLEETSWGEIEFREAASRDFMMGGKYGNPIAKALAVATNPTAKLCGEMVKEAMKNEYGG